jgi:hypothetical protein
MVIFLDDVFGLVYPALVVSIDRVIKAQDVRLG